MVITNITYITKGDDPKGEDVSDVSDVSDVILLTLKSVKVSSPFLPFLTSLPLRNEGAKERRG